MQQEAVSRVHEFQSRAQDVSSFYDMPTIGEAPPPPLPVIEAESHLVPTPDQPDSRLQQPTDPIHGLLEKLNIDSETLLIMGLIFLLYNEKADNVLLIALAYLLL